MNQHLERLNFLAPFLLPCVTGFLTDVEKKTGRTMLVTQGWRSFDEQRLIYQQGRALSRESGEWEVVDPSKVVTKAKPGTSPHNVVDRRGVGASLAVDVIPLNPDGSVDWEPGAGFWATVYKFAWKRGLDPLGDEIGAVYLADKGHFEEPNWMQKLDGLGLVLPSMV